MHLGADESAEAGQLMPVRMLNEFTYCPRLFYLEWVQGEFVDNEFTVEGRFAHRRVDARVGTMPAPDEKAPFEIRSVPLSSSPLGLSAKIDVVEGEGGAVCPVDYKRGKPPPNDISYRRILEVQCRLLARHLLGEIASYPEFRTR